jgi:predicted ABC-type ATPase
MINLIKLLTEAVGEPVAIFLAGAPGAGKSTILRQTVPNWQQFAMLNVDDDYEELLKQAGIGLDLKNLDASGRSAAAKLMSVARKSFDAKYEKLMADRRDIIIDGTAESVKPVQKKKAELEELGYRTIMLFVMASPMTSIERNIKRGLEGGRALKSQIVFRTWQGVVANVEEYRNMFDDRFILVFSDEDPFRWDRAAMEAELMQRLPDEEPLTPEKTEKIQQSLDQAEQFLKSPEAELARQLAQPVAKAKAALQKHMK